MSYKKVPLSNGAEGVFVKNSRFNTTLITFNFYLPTDRERVAEFGLLPFILTTCSKKYPDFSALNFKLSKLYGAALTATCEKIGDYQLLKMAVSVINDKYTLDGEEIVCQATQLLNELVFEPKVENGEFCQSDLDREKRKAIEHIRGEFAEKRVYAKSRMLEEMYKNDSYGVAKCGKIEDVEKITAKSLYKAWEDLLKHAFIRVNVVSDTLPQGIFDTLSQKLDEINRDGITDISATSPTKSVKRANNVSEYSDIKQGKLVMGFSVDKIGGDKDTADVLVFGDIFGGGPYSKLFTNVREKMSLCYYCSARTVRIKGLLTVESGVEADNADKAKKAILNELSEIKNGNVSDMEFDSSIKGITDSLMTYNDSQEALENWYATRIADEEFLSPEEFAQKVKEVTKEDVTAIANKVALNTVYKLLPKEETK